MSRMIPKSTKVKIQFLKGLNLTDLFVGLFALVFLALAWTSGFSIVVKIVISGITVLVFAILFLSISPGVKMYNMVGDLFRHFFGINTYKKMKGNSNKNVSTLLPYVGILEQEYDDRRQIGIIDYKEYCPRTITIKGFDVILTKHGEMPEELKDDIIEKQRQEISVLKCQLKKLTEMYESSEYRYSSLIQKLIENDICLE